MNRRTALLVVAATATAITSSSCSKANNDRAIEGSTADVVEAGTDVFATAVDLDVRNARSPMDGIVTAGQPSTEQMEALVGAGVRHAISLRPSSEEGAGWEEAHAIEGGYRFERLAISGAESLTRENVETFAAMLEEAGGEPTLLYCASSNRVGALLALKAAWIDGVAAEDAIELGLAAGLTRLEAPVRELLGVS